MKHWQGCCWYTVTEMSVSTPENSIKDIRLTFSPRSPITPLGPISPWGPCEPIGPVSPVKPTAPVAPCNPRGPWGPTGPAGPDTVPELACKHNSTMCHTQLQIRRCGSASDSWSVDTCQSWVRAPSKATVVSLSKKLYSHCLVLVGSRNGFERDLHK